MSQWRARLLTMLSAVLLVVMTSGCAEDKLASPSATPMAYSLYGAVNDTAGRPISDVRIEVLDGPRAGVWSTTDASGRYELPGRFSGAITVRAGKDGYVSVTKQIDPDSSSQERRDLTIVLEPGTPSVNLTGKYTLTLTAADSCLGIPEPARSRSYTALIAPQRGAEAHQYEGVLSGATFLPTDGSSRILISVAGTIGRFYLGDPYGWTDAIVEELSPSTYVAIWGEGDLAVGDGTISGPLDRDDGFEYCVSPTPPIDFIGVARYRCPVEPVKCQLGNLTLARH